MKKNKNMDINEELKVLKKTILKLTNDYGKGGNTQKRDLWNAYNDVAKVFEVEKIKTITPLVKEKINWSRVIRIAEEEVVSIADGTFHEDNDNDGYLAEEVYKAIYGENFYDWRNKMT